MPRCPTTCPLGGQGFLLSRAGLAPFVSPSVMCGGVGGGMHFTPTLLGEQPVRALSRCTGLLRAEQSGLVSRSAEMQAPGSLLPSLLSLPQRQPSSTLSALCPTVPGPHPFTRQPSGHVLCPSCQVSSLAGGGEGTGLLPRERNKLGRGQEPPAGDPASSPAPQQRGSLCTSLHSLGLISLSVKWADAHHTLHLTGPL